MTERVGRGYSWPPFEPGNEAALRHGAWSDRKVAPIAEQIAATLAEVAPWTDRPAYRAEVAAWSQAEARVVLLNTWLDEHGILDDAGKPRPALAALERAEGRASRLRDRLGLNPTALARLLTLVAALPAADRPEAGGLEQLMNDGRRALEGRTGGDS